jgi:anti-sigma-K factor RskA
MMRKLDRGDMQDRLPEYVHGTLPADERAQIDAALAHDEDLARELDVVRAVRSAFAGVSPSIDIGRIVTALPASGRPRRNRASMFRIAAAIATLAVGGASLAVVQQTIRGDVADSLVIRGESVSATVGEELALSFGYDLSALDDDDLAALLADLEKSGGLPPAEPRRGTVSDGGQEDGQ